MAVTADHFRLTMSHLGGAVTVLVARDAVGGAHGMTASAVTSLSLSPPMLLACVDHEAAIHDIIVSAGVFAVNILARHQVDQAIRFAERDRHAIDGGGVPRSPAGLPLIPGAIAHIEVRRGQVLTGGDHSIVTGVVEWSQLTDGPPLLYFRSRYTGAAE
ncbi:MAG TPA: flavin reductase family protein [Gemmatimonadales bacterium]|jgi:flavin reductase (DIM6/NTAB) family NADH-FMN oxidoreductase RutF